MTNVRHDKNFTFLYAEDTALVAINAKQIQNKLNHNDSCLGGASSPWTLAAPRAKFLRRCKLVRGMLTKMKKAIDH